MKLVHVLHHVNQMEKTKFLNFLDRVCNEAIVKDNRIRDQLRQLELDGQIKQASSAEIKNLFEMVLPHFKKAVAYELSLLGGQTDIMTGIISRDGNSIARLSWLERLYERDWQEMDSQSKELSEKLKVKDDEESRNLSIYHQCYRVAFVNDEAINRESKISYDEKTVLNELARQLKITDDDRIMVEHLVDPIPAGNINECLETLREIGLIFISKKSQYAYVPSEIVSILHEIDGTDLSNKYIRRLLRTLSDPELSNINKAHGKRIRNVSRVDKINNVLKMKLNASDILLHDMHAVSSTLTSKRERLKRMMTDLDIDPERLGGTIEERADIIIKSLRQSALHEFDVLTPTGFNEMYGWLSRLSSQEEELPSVESRVREEFEIEQNENIDAERLRSLSITPFDILYLYSNDEIKHLCDDLHVSRRGNCRYNIIEKFIDITDKLVENYEILARRDYMELSRRGLDITEANIGVKFEEATKAILEQLNLSVDEELRRQLNTSKDKADVIVSLNETDIIIIETKTIKDSQYSKYSSVSRQVKSYVRNYESLGKRVSRVVVIAPEYSDGFIKSAEMDMEINISLLEAAGLKKLLDVYKSKRMPKFSPMLFTKGVFLNADLLAKTI